jgi:general secretion pathway protein A
MNLEFYNLREQPYGVTPDPRFLYLSTIHREALESLQEGLAVGRGFTALIADAGLGKTTLLFDFLSKADNASNVFLFQPQGSPGNLFRSLLEELRIPHDPADVVQMQHRLSEWLARESDKGRRVIVVIDEAQSLDESVLESVRLLSNFETPSKKLMHLILAGQPALAAMLASPRLVQLRQRISVIARLYPLDASETQPYIDHRLRVAGYDGKVPIFTKRALEAIAYQSGGIPRNINTICFNALLKAGDRKLRPIDSDVIEEVVGALDLQPIYEGRSKPRAQRKPPAKGEAVPVKQILSSPPKSSMNRWWLRAALILVGMGGLGGILVRANWHPVHSAISVKVQGPELAPLSPSVAASEAQPMNPDDAEITGRLLDIHQTEPAPTSPSEAPTAAMGTHASYDPTFVTVQPNQTIFRICMENLGRYDDEIAAKIRQLNPGIGDFTQIKAGQRIRMPAGRRAPKSSRGPVAQDENDATSGAGKP